MIYVFATAAPKLVEAFETREDLKDSEFYHWLVSNEDEKLISLRGNEPQNTLIASGPPPNYSEDIPESAFGVPDPPYDFPDLSVNLPEVIEIDHEDDPTSFVEIAVKAICDWIATGLDSSGRESKTLKDMTIGYVRFQLYKEWKFVRPETSYRMLQDYAQNIYSTLPPHIQQAKVGQDFQNSPPSPAGPITCKDPKYEQKANDQYNLLRTGQMILTRRSTVRPSLNGTPAVQGSRVKPSAVSRGRGPGRGRGGIPAGWSTGRASRTEFAITGDDEMQVDGVNGESIEAQDATMGDYEDSGDGVKYLHTESQPLERVQRSAMYYLAGDAW